jgi:protein-S-isoprenylcysteine O-methyltransferase Ste14
VTTLEPHFIVRAGAVYGVALVLAALWLWRRPARRVVAGAMLASAWNVPVVLGLHVLAMRYGWWHFDARGGLFLGMPVDLYAAWVCLWSVIPALAFPVASLVIVAAFALALDLLFMPAGAPVIQLGPHWLVGEAVGLLFGVIPGQLLARWTARDTHLAARAALQVLAFSGLLLFVLPVIAIDGSGTGWTTPLSRPGWQLSLIAQLLALVGLIGLTAVQEFVERGGGTPVPFDPPKRIVTTGIYAYVRNPMQLSAVLLLLMLGAVLQNWWVAASGIVAHIYSAGLAGWDEGEDLRGRFGNDWAAYRKAVRPWVPRFRPWHLPSTPPARLYVSEECSMCSEVGRWFQSRGARHLEIVPAERHGTPLTRITYESETGHYQASGIIALSRALEHLHLGWALVGFACRLPVVSTFVQLLADASGAQPRRIAQRPLNTPHH